MITINTWINNYIIAHDPHSKIEIDSLNKLFVSLVDKIGGSDQDSIERAKRKGEYLLIAGHANIKYELLARTFQDFLKQFEIGYDWRGESSADNISLFNELNILPTEDPSTGAIGGGVPDDNQNEIELGILPLVTILNTFDGIRTFGSCEGHYVKSDFLNAYISWTACNINGLNYSTFLLKNAINGVWEKRKLNDDENFNINQIINRITLSFNTGYWKPARLRTAPLPGENFYHFRFDYEFKFRSLVFNIINDIAEHIINEKYELSKEI